MSFVFWGLTYLTHLKRSKAMHPSEYDPVAFPPEDDGPDDEWEVETRCDYCGMNLDVDPCICGPAGPKLDGVWTGENGKREKMADAQEAVKTVPARDALGYPKDWPKCPSCGLPVLDGHRTCGNFFCGPERG